MWSTAPFMGALTVEVVRCRPVRHINATSASATIVDMAVKAVTRVFAGQNVVTVEMSTSPSAIARGGYNLTIEACYDVLSTQIT